MGTSRDSILRWGREVQKDQLRLRGLKLQGRALWLIMPGQLPVFALFAVLVAVELWLLFRKPEVLSKAALWPMGSFAIEGRLDETALREALGTMPAVGAFEVRGEGFVGYLRSQGLRMAFDRALFVLRFSVAPGKGGVRIRFRGAALPIAYLPFLLAFTATAEGPNAFETTLFLWGALVLTWLLSLFVGRKMAKRFAKELGAS